MAYPTVEQAALLAAVVKDDAHRKPAAQEVGEYPKHAPMIAPARKRGGLRLREFDRNRRRGQIAAQAKPAPGPVANILTPKDLRQAIWRSRCARSK
jgi:hypothetical protein